MNKAPSVFISYARPDEKLAHIVTRQILDMDCEVMRHDDLIEARLWRKEIGAQIDRSQKFVLVVSKDAAASSRVRDEWAEIQEKLWKDKSAELLTIKVEPMDTPAFLRNFVVVECNRLDTGSLHAELRRFLNDGGSADHLRVRSDTDDDMNDAVSRRFEELHSLTEKQLDFILAPRKAAPPAKKGFHEP